jgi:hypothetical protein
MCVLNQEDEFNGIESDFRCGMCQECTAETIDAENEEKYKNTSCGNCGFCEECC